MPEITAVIPKREIDAVNKLLDGWKWLANDLTVPMKRFGVYYLGVVDRTFREQGRPPGSWAPLSPMTLGIRDHRKKRFKVTSIAALVDRGHLRRSFTVEAQPKGLKVGTPDERASRLHGGGSVTRPETVIRPRKKGGVLHFNRPDGTDVFCTKVVQPAKTYKVPARPMITWTPDDDKRLEDTTEKFFNEKAAQMKGRAT